MEEWVGFDSSGSRLVGVLTRPNGADTADACVVFIHGWGGYRIGPHRLIVKVSRTLAERGICCLRFDLRGRGDSEGEPDAATLDTMISDTCAAIDFLRARFPDAEMSLWGICSGGNVAIGAATLRSEVKRMVLLSTLPFVGQKKAAEKIARTRKYAGGYFRKLFSFSTWKRLLTGAIDLASVRGVLFGHYGKSTERDRKNSARDVMSAFRDYAGSVLFIHGGADREAVDAREHYETFTNEVGIPSRFVTIDGSNHDFYSLEWEREITELTLNWIERA